MNALVCVTGASGFVGSAIVKELLDHGYRVRGTARSPAGAFEHLRPLAGADDRLEVVAADLEQPGSLDRAVAGCDYVVHAASPYVLTVADTQRDLIDPAVRGTLEVLESSLAATTVRRVVVTSSFAAMTDEPDGTYDESHWNTSSSVTRNPYYFSKVSAESAAWEFASRNAFDLVAINPSLVIGPSLVPSLNVSNQVLADFTTRRYPGILDFGWGIVDIRDVAAAHRLALEVPSASGRYLCAADVWTMRQIVESVKNSDLGLARLPTLSLDNAWGRTLVRLAATFQPSGSRDFLRTNLGRRFRIDTTRIRSGLGMKFRSVEDSILDAYRDLQRWGHI